MEDELIKQTLKEILIGLKAKLIQPVLDENLKIAQKLAELKEQDRENSGEIKEKLAELETRIQQVPLLILTALRDAINQAGGEN